MEAILVVDDGILLLVRQSGVRPKHGDTRFLFLGLEELINGFNLTRLRSDASLAVFGKHVVEWRGDGSKEHLVAESIAGINWSVAERCKVLVGNQLGDVGKGGLELGKRLFLLEAGGEPDSHADKGDSRALLLFDGDAVKLLLVVEGKFVSDDVALVAIRIPD
ncbi:hypothetical protein SNK03_005721 [Fusarium graminearum]